MESSSRRFSFGAIGVEMGKWPPVGVSSPLASRVCGPGLSVSMLVAPVMHPGG